MNPPNQVELWEELNVKTTWFHVLRAAILDDKIAEMGTTAWAVYCVIKAYTNMETGKSFPSLETIAGHIGVSVDTVMRAVDRLMELGLVEREKVGRKSTYHLIESFPLTRSSDGERVGAARQTYAPMGFQGLVSQLQQYAQSGAMPPGATFNITLNVTQVTGEHATVNVNSVVMGEGGAADDVRASSLAKIRGVVSDARSKK